MIPVCDWDRPGAEVYRGTHAAAVAAMPMAADARAKLLAKIRAGKWDDQVTITRDEIRGTHSYSPEIRFMSFGANGKVCQDVSRANWKPGHVERALVYCVGDWCAARPSVCNNWFMAQRRPAIKPPDVPPAAPEQPLEALPALPAAPPVPAVPPGPPTAALAPPGTFEEGCLCQVAVFVSGGGGFIGGGGGGGSGGGGRPPPEQTPVTPIPEPREWMLLLAGFAAFLMYLRRKSR